MKKRYEQQVGLHETFIESVPTALIITFLSVNSLGRKMLTGRCIHTKLSLIAGGDEVLRALIYDENSTQSMVLFWITLAISVISSGFGLTKCLMVGVASTMADNGPAEGLLSCKFLLGICGKLSLISLISYLASYIWSI